jgi:hypothetical protein
MLTGVLRMRQTPFRVLLRKGPMIMKDALPEAGRLEPPSPGGLSRSRSLELVGLMER